MLRFLKKGIFMSTLIYTSGLISLGKSLAELAVKGTATAVSTRIKAIKNEKTLKK